jgi:predicted alpha/beta-hydrolase family hydrolase
VIPDLPLQDPEAGFEERIRPALEALDGIAGPLVIVGHSQGTAYSSLVAAANLDALLVHLCPRLGEPPGAWHRVVHLKLRVGAN